MQFVIMCDGQPWTEHRYRASGLPLHPTLSPRMETKLLEAETLPGSARHPDLGLAGGDAGEAGSGD